LLLFDINMTLRYISALKNVELFNVYAQGFRHLGQNFSSQRLSLLRHAIIIFWVKGCT